MRKVGIFALQPGLVLARAIYNHNVGLLLGKGTVLTHQNIRKLESYGVPYVYVEDDLLTGIEPVPLISHKVRRVAEQQLEKIMSSVRATGKLRIKSAETDVVTQQILDQLVGKKHLMLNLMDLRVRDNYTFVHSVNVCVLALMTGLTLGYTKNELLLLGTGALLHDVGKEMIPDMVLNKPGRLNAEEYEIIKNHTFYGYELIRAVKSLGEIPAIISLQHHEHYDGSGYPQGLKKNAFHEFAQIVAIADKFDALTSNRVYRRAFLPHQAYELCAASGNYFVHEKIMRAFLYNIAAYAPGTMVQLNTGQVGVVIDTPKGYSLFPRVKILFDNLDTPIPPHELSLTKTPGLAVTRVVEDEEAVALILKHKAKFPSRYNDTNG